MFVVTGRTSRAGAEETAVGRAVAHRREPQRNREPPAATRKRLVTHFSNRGLKPGREQSCGYLLLLETITGYIN